MEPNPRIGGDRRDRIEGIDGAGARGAGRAHHAEGLKAGAAIGLDLVLKLAGVQTPGRVDRHPPQLDA